MIRVTEAPNLTGKGRVDLSPSDFDVVIYQKGLDVTIEKAVMCPCKLADRGFVPSCPYCGGSGYMFMSPVRTKAVIQSMNSNVRQSEWSLEKLGTATITTRAVDRLSEMDRVTLIKETSTISQVIPAFIVEESVILYLSYDAVDVSHVFFIDRRSGELVPLDSEDFVVNGRVMKIDINRFDDLRDMSVSVTYSHNVAYHVIDIIRDIRSSNVEMKGVKNKQYPFPLSGILRRSHLVLKPTGYYNPLSE